MRLSASLAVHSNSEKLKFAGVSREEFFKEGCLHGYCWKTAACVYEHKYAALGMRWNRLNTIWFDPFTWFSYLFHNMFMLFAHLGFSIRAQSPTLMLFIYYWSHVFILFPYSLNPSSLVCPYGYLLQHTPSSGVLGSPTWNSFHHLLCSRLQWSEPFFREPLKVCLFQFWQ